MLCYTFSVFSEVYMRIVVLCGGLSSERDVSISGGCCIAKALRERGHRVLLMDMYKGYEGDIKSPDELFSGLGSETGFSVPETVPEPKSISGPRIGSNVTEICAMADIVFLSLHGADGEDGKIQAMLDLNGIKFTGTGFRGSCIAMDKKLSKTLFEANGIPTPQSVLLKKGEKPLKAPWYPCVIKPCCGGSSVATSIVESDKEYSEALKAAFAIEDRVLCEKHIKGRELTVGVMDGKAMPSIELIVHDGWYDYKNKYQPNRTKELCPAPIPDDLSQRLAALAEKVCDVLSCEVYCRVDFILDEEENELYCLEANTLPGMTSVSLIPKMAEQLDMDLGELCDKIIKLSMEKYEK